MLLGVMIHPVLALAGILVMAFLASIVGPGAPPAWMPDWVRVALYAILPSTGLLSEGRFLEISEASVHATPWTVHLTSLAYGLDYAAACFLLAVLVFRRKNLTRA
jgi:hypothetical protein